jgi:hypothetical protein
MACKLIDSLYLIFGSSEKVIIRMYHLVEKDVQ